MRCEDLMKKDVQCISPKDTVESAARRMRDQGVGFLPVCDAAKKVIGAVTDRDITIRAVAEKRNGGTTVDQVMTREIVACRPSDDIRRVHELMAQKQKSRIMCLDEEGRLVGVISLSDVAQVDHPMAQETLRRVSEREVRL